MKLRQSRPAQKPKWKQEEQLMLGKTAEDVRKILENSEREIEAAVRYARKELVAFAANLAVSITHQSMRIDEKTDQNLVSAFANELSPRHFL